MKTKRDGLKAVFKDEQAESAERIVGSSEETITGDLRLDQRAAEGEYLARATNLDDLVTEQGFGNSNGFEHSLPDG